MSPNEISVQLGAPAEQACKIEPYLLLRDSTKTSPESFGSPSTLNFIWASKN